ncbi:MAG: YceI family protein [Pseudomonadota bacterium]
MMGKPHNRRVPKLVPWCALAGALLCSWAAWADHHEGGLGVPAGAYEVEPTHAYITFSYSHLGFSTPHLGFDRFAVDLDLDPADLARSSLSVIVDAASVDSRVAEFDDHLKGPDFFAVAEHPEIRFTSTAIEMTGATKANITGDLTIKGVTKPVVLEARIDKAAMHPMLKKPVVGVSAFGTLSRSAFGLGKYVPAVGDEVELYITAELVKVDAPQE